MSGIKIKLRPGRPFTYQWDKWLSQLEKSKAGILVLNPGEHFHTPARDFACYVRTRLRRKGLKRKVIVTLDRSSIPERVCLIRKDMAKHYERQSE